MSVSGSSLLSLGAALSALAALAHIGVVLGGPDWYRFFGAGEGMARMAERGSVYPAVITLAIAAVLAVWSAYALSGAGHLPALPWLKWILLAITAVYCLRGVAGFVLAGVAPGANGMAFWLWSSSICLLIGLIHVFGLRAAWSRLAL